MTTKTKPKTDPEFRMSEAEFDDAMRKAFGAPPPEKEPKKATSRARKSKQPKEN